MFFLMSFNAFNLNFLVGFMFKPTPFYKLLYNIKPLLGYLCRVATIVDKRDQQPHKPVTVIYICYKHC